MDIISLDKKNHFGLSKPLRKLGIRFSNSVAEDSIIGRLVSVNGIAEIREQAKISFGDIIGIKVHKITIE